MNDATMPRPCPDRSSEPPADRAAAIQALPYAGDTYYERPAIKPSHYGWKVALYTYLAGLAGSAHLIGTVAGFARAPGAHRTVRDSDRIAAAIGAGAGPLLLIADLHSPERWYNMLRIFRSTSPMSIGSYLLTAFGASATLAGVMRWTGERARSVRLRRAAQAVRVPAAVAAAGMSTYTAPLLSATSAPVWASAPKWLGAEFATSAFAAGAAALTLSRRGEDAAALDRIAAVATIGKLAATTAMTQAQRSIVGHAVYEERAHGLAHKAGVALGIALPLACYAVNTWRGPSARRSTLAAAAVLSGGMLMRWALFQAGNASAQRPRDYFRFASARQPQRPAA